jgi:hypothetical protein
MTMTLVCCLALDLAILALTVYRLERQVERAQVERDAAIHQRDDANEAIQRMALDRIRESGRMASLASGSMASVQPSTGARH